MDQIVHRRYCWPPPSLLSEVQLRLIAKIISRIAKDYKIPVFRLMLGVLVVDRGRCRRVEGLRSLAR
jgi:hypothetical protein